MTVVKVEGLKKFSSELKKTDKGMAKEFVKVSKDAAEIVADAARQNAPRKTGKLAGSIKAGATQAGGTVKVGGLPYAKVIHFGWPRHNIAPQPFLFHARDERYEEVLAKFEEGLRKFIDGSFSGGTGE